MNKFSYILILLLYPVWGFSQTVSGNLSLLAKQSIKLEGFNGLKTYLISSSNIDENGNFNLSYSKTDHGVGYVMSADEKPLFVILSGEDIEIVGEALSQPETIKIIKGQENKWFEQYAEEQPKREQALTAWTYLEEMYLANEEFKTHTKAKQAIREEQQHLKAKDEDFIASLPEDSYVRWFLPTRKLVSNVSTIAQYRPKEIPETIAAFRALDYTDKRLYKSGLFKDAIDNHFWLLENSGQPLDQVFESMKTSIDAMFEKLVFDEEKLNIVTNHLFDLLEKHSLFEASEYLALKALNETSCTLNSDLAKQLESYRAMKKGKTAPDIRFTKNTIFPNQPIEKLSDLQSPYTLVVFGASWCPKCQEEIPELAQYYNSWKKEGVELVLVSLDDNETDFRNFTKDFPFISTTDYKKWDGQIVSDYYVFSTPTMYLLDSKREILLRPNSIEQMKAWVDWFLVKGNR